MFTVPEILLSFDHPSATLSDSKVSVDLSNQQVPTRKDFPPESVLGGDRALDKLLYNNFAHEQFSSDRVDWINFLAFLRIQTEDWKMHESQCHSDAAGKRPFSHANARDSKILSSRRRTWCKIKYIQHSWDFMPPDAPKPLASSTVGDIAIMVRRTGMIWTQFQPDQGIMTAEGGPHIITSTNLRMGLVLRYRCLDSNLRKNVEKYLGDRIIGEDLDSEKGRLGHLTFIQSGMWRGKTQAQVANLEKGKIESSPNDEDEINHPKYPKYDLKFMNNLVHEEKTMFGLIPSDPALDAPDFPYATKEECWDTIKELSGKDELRNFISNHHWVDRYEFNDLLLMAPPCLWQRGQNQWAFRTRHYFASVFNFTEMFFVTLLTRYLTKESLGEDLPQRANGGTEQMKRVLESARKLTDFGLDGSKLSHDQLDELQDAHEDTTEYFRNTVSRGLTFHALLKAHFHKAPYCAWQAREDCDPKKTNPPRSDSLPPSKGEHPWRNRNMELYFTSVLPDVIAVMKSSGCEDEDLIIESWLTLMLRAFLLLKLCSWSSDLKVDYLPRKYYGSRIPVWLE